LRRFIEANAVKITTNGFLIVTPYLSSKTAKYALRLFTTSKPFCSGI